MMSLLSTTIMCQLATIAIGAVLVCANVEGRHVVCDLYMPHVFDRRCTGCLLLETQSLRLGHLKLLGKHAESTWTPCHGVTPLEWDLRYANRASVRQARNL